MSMPLTLRYGLKFQPFLPSVPDHALLVRPEVDTFLSRVSTNVRDGGFALVAGDPGLGKSAVLRLLKARLQSQRDVLVGSIDHPQSRIGDFYRELGDLFGVPLAPHNLWGGFRALRQRWADHMATTLTRPVLIIDEAQEMQSSVFAELRLLTSKDFDANALLCVIFAGDARLLHRLRQPELAPLDSRIRRRLLLEPASPDDLRQCLDHLLDSAGNSALMTDSVKSALADSAAGNYRVLMHMADELLSAAAERELSHIDDKLYFDTFTPRVAPSKRAGRSR